MRRLVCGLAVMAAACEPPDPPLVGVWRVVERSYTRGDSSWIENPTPPGLYLFDRTYYGIQEIRESGPRPQFDQFSSDTERLKAFDVFHAHSGRYELGDTVITIWPEIAKGPNTMSGNAATYGYTMSGDTLIFTRVSTAERETRTTRLLRVPHGP